MNFNLRPRFGLVLVIVVVSAVILQQFWHWEVERVDVPAGQYLVLTHHWGKNLPEGEIIAPDESYKGIILDEVREGRHFFNPLFWSYERHTLITVPPGKCLVLTRKFGRQIPPERLERGEILAEENPANWHDGERGILKEVKPPGSHRLNPHAYSWELIPAVEVRPDQVGVRCLKVGLDPRRLPKDARRSPYVVPDGCRGVQEKIVPNGTYYLNPYVETITPVEVRSHKVELSDIEFPSRDGFLIKPHVLVEYAVQPDKAPELLIRLTDEGLLHQEDATPEQQLKNEVLQKVILPHIRGYARIEGSNFDAHDFIVVAADAAGPKAVNAREKLQRALYAKVKPKCQDLGIDVRAVTLADMEPPVELALQIRDRELARVEQEKNKVRLGQYKAEQKLKAAEALKEQAKEKVEAETRRLQATTRADQRKEVESLRLKQDLLNAQLKLDAARKQAEALLAKGKAEAAVIRLQNEAEVAGLRQAVQGFTSVSHFAQYHVLSRLAPALAEVFASDDSDFARLLSNYMTQPSTPAAPPAPAGKPVANVLPPPMSR